VDPKVRSSLAPLAVLQEAHQPSDLQAAADASVHAFNREPGDGQRPQMLRRSASSS
jgi:hypothetical protein